jgi:hypothetical protein
MSYGCPACTEVISSYLSPMVFGVNGVIFVTPEYRCVYLEKTLLRGLAEYGNRENRNVTNFNKLQRCMKSRIID